MSDRRLPSLDLVRGLAAFCVALPHYLVLADRSAQVSEMISVLAVEVFFVLSGYVLARQILDCVASRAWQNVGIFLARRWMRTVPPYLFALAAVSLLSEQSSGPDLARYGCYVQSLLWPANVHDYYPVAWSLSVEEWFYVTFPVIAFACLRSSACADLRGCVYVALAFVASIALVRLAFGDADDWGERVRRVVVFRVDSIAYGFLLYAATSSRLPLQRLRAGGAWILAALLLFAGAAALACAGVSAIALRASRLSQQLFPFYAALFGSGAILLFCTLDGHIERAPRLAAFASYLGRISYSVYLFHILVAQILEARLAPLPLAAQLGFYVGAVLLFCSVFYTCFERPILAARPRYRLRTGAAEPRALLPASA